MKKNEKQKKKKKRMKSTGFRGMLATCGLNGEDRAAGHSCGRVS